MGNLVTNADWEHFWLNEGFTVFIERKIIGRIFGEETRHFESILGHHHLKGDIEHFGASHEFTKLVPKLVDIDPDDAFSSVPYEKGSSFLFYLESIVGKDGFEQFLKNWVQRNRFSTVTTDQFKALFLETFQKDHASALEKVDWNAWLYGPGLPPVDMLSMFNPVLANLAIELARKWNSNDWPSPPTDADLKGWSSKQIALFLEHIPETSASGQKKLLPLDTLKKMEELYGFRKSRNSEVRFKWYMISIEHEKADIFPDVVAFLKEQGRMKFVRPLYRALAKSKSGRELAISTFKEHQNFYHNIAKKMIASDLGL